RRCAEPGLAAASALYFCLTSALSRCARAHILCKHIGLADYDALFAVNLDFPNAAAFVTPN
ncbi:MAG: hypothetical protein RRY69_01745, partial [Oscillospiraceae bacterium]